MHNLLQAVECANKEFVGLGPQVHGLAMPLEELLLDYIYSGESSPVLQLITWVPTHEMAKRGCPSTTYINTLLRDTLL